MDGDIFVEGCLWLFRQTAMLPWQKIVDGNRSFLMCALSLVVQRLRMLFMHVLSVQNRLHFGCFTCACIYVTFVTYSLPRKQATYSRRILHHFNCLLPFSTRVAEVINLVFCTSYVHWGVYMFLSRNTRQNWRILAHSLGEYSAFFNLII